MKILIILAILAGCVFLISCFTPKVNFSEDTPDGIQFRRQSWSETLACAKLENKPIFLDIYASWCGPCRKLKSTTFASKDVGYLFNDSFINIALDGEKGDGPGIASQYQVRGYPTLLFLDPKGNIISREVGYQDRKDLLQLGKNALSQFLNKMETN